MAKTRAGETLVVPGHPDYEPVSFDSLAQEFKRENDTQDDGWDADCG